ncbi:hypothetical protein PspLS_03529, partial [Pyricularia sp. CBS 133598]
ISSQSSYRPISTIAYLGSHNLISGQAGLILTNPVVALQQSKQSQQAKQLSTTCSCLHHCVGVDRIGKPTNGADLQQTKINERTGKPSNQSRFQARSSVNRHPSKPRYVVHTLLLKPVNRGIFPSRRVRKRDMHCMPVSSASPCLPGFQGFGNLQCRGVAHHSGAHLVVFFPLGS